MMPNMPRRTRRKQDQAKKKKPLARGHVYYNGCQIFKKVKKNPQKIIIIFFVSIIWFFF